jgi:hypothetical protein
MNMSDEEVEVKVKLVPVKLCKGFLYSHDQITVTTYEAGEQEVPEEIAAYAAANGFAEEEEGADGGKKKAKAKE